LDDIIIHVCQVEKLILSNIDVFQLKAIFRKQRGGHHPNLGPSRLNLHFHLQENVQNFLKNQDTSLNDDVNKL